MADDKEKVSQNEIEELLRQAQAAARPVPAPVAVAPVVATATAAKSAPVAPSAGFALGGDELAHIINSAKDAVSGAGAASAATGSLDDVQFLLAQAERTYASVDHPEDTSGMGASPFELRDFGGTPASSEKATLDLLRDVELGVKIELGRTNMYLEDVLKMRRGSVVSLDKLAGDPVDIFVNGRLIARGEVLVLNDNFCVRVAELVSGDDL